MTSKRQVFTVTQVNKYVKKILETDALLGGLFIEGELSNFNAHSSGHLYFTLKDATASVSAVMFRGSAESLSFTPKSGMKVVVFGKLSMYEKTGQYQLYVEYMEPAGIGGLQLKFNELCEKLKGEGLFDNSRKRAIPQFAKTVAVITSPTGAAVQDIIKIIRGRNTAVRVVVVPALVQGDGAASDLKRAIEDVNGWGEADVIILGRGGGSIEDLWAFNEEILARAVVSSKIPIISAVGHETDFTICDFVSDKRAETPTAAAQMAVYDQTLTFEYLKGLVENLNNNLVYSIKERFENTKTLMADLNKEIKDKLLVKWQGLMHQEAILEKVSPYAAFRRGYALVRDGEKIVVSAIEVKVGQKLNLNWADGSAEVLIEKVEN